MIYCSVEHWKTIECAHLELALKDNGEVNELKISAAIHQAANIADSWMASRYRTPITDSARLRVIEAQIVPVVTFVLARGSGAISEDITHRYNDALNWFKAVGSGQIDLPDTASASSSQNGAGSGSGDIVFSAKSKRF